MNKPKCFMELCAGTAALSVRLVGGKDAKPPVSRMGAKTGYADVILSVLGLYPGLGAESFVWCEPDDGVRGLLMAYCQPMVLREAAAILRGWKDEEPRALWERLRAELRAGVSVDGAEGVARFVQLLGANRLIPGTIADDGRWVNAARDGGPQTDGGVSFGGEEFATSAADNADRLTQVPSLPPTFIARDGRAVTPEDVARLMVLWGMSIRNVGPDGSMDLHKMQGAPATETFGAIIPLWEPLARRLEENGEIGWPPVTITDDARTLTPNKLPEGVIVYMDPPYLNTTGYKHDLSREEVIRMARLWSDAGATVCISEQSAIPELISDGWHGVQISFARKGQKRTFSEQQDEYLTINRKPAFIPREPEPMFDDLKVVKKPKVKVVRVSQLTVTPTEPINQPAQTLNLFGRNNG